MENFYLSLLDNRCHYHRYILFNRFGWGRTVLIYDTPAYRVYGGDSSGYLLAATIHTYMLSESIEVFGWELLAQQTYEEMLVQVVGNNYASESCLGVGWGAINTACLWFFEWLCDIFGRAFKYFRNALWSALFLHACYS